MNEGRREREKETRKRESKNLLLVDRDRYPKMSHVQLVCHFCVTYQRQYLRHSNEKREDVKQMSDEGVGHVFMSTQKLPVELAVIR